MTTIGKVLGFGALAVLVVPVVALVAAFSPTTCGLQIQITDPLVRTFVLGKRLDLRNLSVGAISTDQCSADYTYRGGGEALDITVLDDPLHGPKVTYWDHRRDATGE